MPEMEQNPTPRPAPYHHADKPERLVSHEIKQDWTRYQVPGLVVAAVILAISAYLLVQDNIRRQPEIRRQIEAAQRSSTLADAAVDKLRLENMPPWLQAYPKARWPRTFERQQSNFVMRTYTFLTTDPAESVIAYYQSVFAARGVVEDGLGKSTTGPGGLSAVAGTRTFSATHSNRLHWVDMVVSPSTSEDGNLVILNYMVEDGAPDL
jgi:hypothetical protein